ncbi:WD40 repeat domain-containing protein [Streptomyces sp. NBC_01511]|uniref:hypothetical protein n=1 Tax=Streptomyces sp. NBC_01511 TaxID=2903889 RepID=UPI003866841E
MTPAGPPSRDFGRYLVEEAPPQDADELRQELLGPGRPLFRLVKRFVGGGDSHALRALYEEVTPLHRLLGNGRGARRVPETRAVLGTPFRDREDAAVNALRSLAGMGLALVDTAAAPDALPPVLRRVEAARVSLPGGPLSSAWTPDGLAEGDEALHHCLTVLAASVAAGQHQDGASLTAALTLQRLAGATPAPRRAPRQLEVLTSRGVQGRHATLRARLLPGGPPGLVPDPGRMSLFSADPRFQTSLERAWSCAGAGRVKGTVLWWLESETGPVHYVEDESLGAAFAVVLDEIHRLHTWASTRRAVRRLADDVAVVGKIDGIGNLHTVGHYRAKLAAADRVSRVVVPVSDQEEAQNFARPGLVVEPARSWQEAARHARRPDGRVIAVNLLLLGLVLAVLSGGLVGVGLLREQARGDERQQISRSRQLVREAADLEATDPGLARQLLLMAYDMSPTDQARGALLNSLTLPGSYTHDARTQGSPVTVAFQPRGELLAVGGTGTVVLQDVQDGRQVAELPGGTGDVGALAFTPDGRTMAVGYGFGDSGAAIPTGSIQLWDVSEPEHARRLSSLTYRYSVTALAFSPQGDLLATGSAGGPTQLWDVARPARPALKETLDPAADAYAVAFEPGGRSTAWRFDGRVTFRGLDGERLGSLRTRANDMAYAPDGVLFATTDTRAREITVWDVTEPRRPRSVTTVPESDGFVRFAPDSRHLVTTYDGAAVLRRLVRLADGRLIHDPNFEAVLGRSAARGADSFGIDVSPDGRTVATASTEGTVRLWDISVPQQPGALSVAADPDFERSEGSGVDLDISEDGERMAVTCGQTVCLWDMSHPRAPEYVGALPEEPLDQVDNPTFSPDGTALFVASRQHYVTVWDIKDLADPSRVTRFEPGEAGAYAFSDDGTRLVSAVEAANTSNTERSAGTDPRNVLVLWDLSDPRRPVRAATLPGVSKEFTIDEIAISADNTVVAALGFAKDLSLWNIATPTRPTRLPGRKVDKENANHLTFSGDSRRLMTGGVNGSGRIWDLKDPPGKTAAPFLAGSLPHDARLAVSRSGELLLTEGDSGTQRVWNVDDSDKPRHLAMLRGAGPYDTGWEFSPDGSLLVSGSVQGIVSVWALDTRDIKSRLCTRPGERITPNQWAQYVPERSYAPPCA